MFIASHKDSPRLAVTRAVVRLHLFMGGTAKSLAKDFRHPFFSFFPFAMSWQIAKMVDCSNYLPLHFYPHYTDEETEIQNFSDLLRVPQAVRKGVRTWDWNIVCLIPKLLSSTLVDGKMWRITLPLLRLTRCPQRQPWPPHGSGTQNSRGI